MKFLARRRLAIFLSLFMTLFLMCQGQAMASGLGFSLASATILSDRMVMIDQQSNDIESHCNLPTQPDGSSDCLHLPLHSQINSIDLPTIHLFVVALVFLFPKAVPDDRTIGWSSLPFHAPISDPPIPIRYQRFNE